MTAAYHFPLEFAQCCSDCNSVSDLRKFRNCPACAGANVMTLGNVLNRPVTHLGDYDPFLLMEGDRI
jgi:hypothetical protein